jgi:peptide/nickel transport system substrate-binding protein
MYGLYYLTGNSSTWFVNYNIFNMNTSNFGPATLALLNQSGVINPSQQLLPIMENQSWPIYVTGPQTIVFHMDTPFLFFTGVLVSNLGLVFDTQYVLQHGGFGTPTQYNTNFNQHPIPGTGPYVVTQLSENQYVSFTQNSNYWGRNLTEAQIASNPLLDPGHAKNVIIYYKPDDLARYTDLSTGQVQIAAIQTSDFNLITSNPEYSYLKQPPWTAAFTALGLNVHLYPTNITLVRQAIVHAINYTDIYSKAYQDMTPFVGPEYPAWKQFYDIGNYPPYQYNLTLAKQYLARANITNMPTFTLRITSGCDSCSTAAQIIQADLAQIGITVNIEVLASNTYFAPYGSFSFNVQNAAEIGQLSFVNAGFAWGPGTLTPADYWVTFVSCDSFWGNWATYCNPTVQKGVDAMVSSNNVTYIRSILAPAQKQIYDDAPYAWLGTFGLWGTAGGSIAWKTSVISGFQNDPDWTGMTTMAIFNTVTFAS